MPHKDLAAKRACDLRNQRKYRQRRKVERASALKARLDARPQWPDADLAWIAGLFEGEGTATIITSGERSRSLCTVTSTDLDVLEPFFRMWPGKRRDYTPKGSPNARQATSWTVEGETMMAFLLDVRPFIRTPRVQAKFDLLLEVQALRQRGSRDPGYAAMMAAYRERMRVLNRRGNRHLSSVPGSSAGI